MAEAAGRARAENWAWCLVPNHVHVILVPPDADDLRPTFAGINGVRLD